MKLAFFALACLLIAVRVYFSWERGGQEGRKRANVLIKSDGLEERISWSGDIDFNDSENAIVRMSPGGYLKYSRNDTGVAIKSDTKGRMQSEYTNAPLTPEGKDSLRRQAISELIHYGYNATNRMEAIYRKGGYPALVAEYNNLKMDNLQNMYMERILSSDSLSPDIVLSMISSMKEKGSDENKRKLLEKVRQNQLDSGVVADAYLNLIRSMGSGDQQKQAYKYLIGHDSLSAHLLTGMIDSIPSVENDNDRMEVYAALISGKTLGEEEWKMILSQVQLLAGGSEKATLLTQIAGKMQMTPELRAAYAEAAKSITSDDEYGKAMRAINKP